MGEYYICASVSLLPRERVAYKKDIENYFTVGCNNNKKKLSAAIMIEHLGTKNPGRGLIPGYTAKRTEIFSIGNPGDKKGNHQCTKLLITLNRLGLTAPQAQVAGLEYFNNMQISCNIKQERHF